MTDLDVEALLDAALEHKDLKAVVEQQQKTAEKEKEKEREARKSKRSHSRSRSPQKSKSHRSHSRESSRKTSSSRKSSRSRSRSRSRREGRERESKRSPTPEPPIESERDERTIFVSNIPLRADKHDVKKFFTEKAGKVWDVRLITDRNSRKSKGVAYIEFYTKASVSEAQSLNGTQMMGQTICIQQTYAEKNKAAQGVVQQPVVTRPSKLMVTNLPSNFGKSDLYALFGGVGEIDSISLQPNSRAGPAAFIQFKKQEDKRKALAQFDGIEIEGKNIRVRESSGKDAGPFAEIEEEEGHFAKMDQKSRVLLMERLQKSMGAEIGPSPISQMVAPSQPPVPQVVVPSVIPPSPCIKLVNAFDPNAETESNWEEDIKEDMIEECSKFGTVLHIFVDKNSQGVVYMKFGSIPSAQASLKVLDKRWFDGRQIHAQFIPEVAYAARFPDA